MSLTSHGVEPRGHSRGRIPGLDELRGIAILTVVLCHFIALRAPWLLYEPVFKYADQKLERTVLTDQGGAAGLSANIYEPTQPHYGPAFPVVGWAHDSQVTSGTGVAALTARIDERASREASLNIALPDRGLPPEYVGSGWAAWFDGRDLRPGSYVLHMDVTGTNGARVRMDRRIQWNGLNSWPFDTQWTAAVASAAVDLFFVISGFLITSILLRTRGARRYFLTFYARRAARILPLAFICVGVSYVFFAETRHHAMAYLLFYANYAAYWTHTGMAALEQMWSLAVEEQFYLLFPLVCFLVPVRRLWIVVLTTIAVSLVFRLTGTYGVVDSLYLTDGRTEVRMIALALGAWLALDRKRPALPPTLTAAILVAGVGLLSWFARRGQIGWFDPVGLGGAVLFVWLAVSQRFRLRNALLAYVGRRCYGYYLIHVFVLIAVARWLPDVGTPIQAVLYLAALAALAHFSFACIERPMLRLAPNEPPAALEGRPASPMEAVAGAAR